MYRTSRKPHLSLACALLGAAAVALVAAPGARAVACDTSVSSSSQYVTALGSVPGGCAAYTIEIAQGFELANAATTTYASAVPLTIEGVGERPEITSPGPSLLRASNANASITIRNLAFSGGSTNPQSVGGLNGGGALVAGALTLVDVEVAFSSAQGDGGGVYAGGDLTITRSTLRDNTSGNAGGAAVGATVVIRDSTIADNIAAGPGGGAHALGSLVVSGSTFRDNSAGGSGGALFGAAAVEASASTFRGNSAGSYGGAIAGIGATTVLTSTLRGNRASLGGAGISSDSDLQLTRSTLAGNVTDHLGGGFLVDGTATVLNATVTGNTASIQGGGGVADSGVTLQFATVVGNSAPAGANLAAHLFRSAPDVLRSVGSVVGEARGGGRSCSDMTSDGVLYSVADDDSCGFGIVVPAGTLGLNPLADNGGPTPTMLPTAASPVIAVVPLSACLQLSDADQRGERRPGVAGATMCDAGAVEVTAVPGAPLAPAVVPDYRSVTITVKPGEGPAPQRYTVTAEPGGATCAVTGATGFCTITGLESGTPYTFRAVAVNGDGPSPASEASRSVKPIWAIDRVPEQLEIGINRRGRLFVDVPCRLSDRSRATQCTATIKSRPKDLKPIPGVTVDTRGVPPVVLGTGTVRKSRAVRDLTVRVLLADRVSTTLRRRATIDVTVDLSGTSARGRTFERAATSLIARPKAIIAPTDGLWANKRFDDNPSVQRFARAVVAMLPRKVAVVRCTGHTDSDGWIGDNRWLGARRAETICRALRARGLTARRYVTLSAGSSDPVATNTTAEGRALNRRVVVSIRMR